MNAKISGFVICVEAIVYLLFDNLHDCTFNSWEMGLQIVTKGREGSKKHQLQQYVTVERSYWSLIFQKFCRDPVYPSRFRTINYFANIDIFSSLTKKQSSGSVLWKKFSEKHRKAPAVETFFGKVTVLVMNNSIEDDLPVSLGKSFK